MGTWWDTWHHHHGGTTQCTLLLLYGSGYICLLICCISGICFFSLNYLNSNFSVSWNWHFFIQELCLKGNEYVPIAMTFLINWTTISKVSYIITHFHWMSEREYWNVILNQSVNLEIWMNKWMSLKAAEMWFMRQIMLRIHWTAKVTMAIWKWLMLMKVEDYMQQSERDSYCSLVI